VYKKTMLQRIADAEYYEANKPGSTLQRLGPTFQYAEYRHVPKIGNRVVHLEMDRHDGYATRNEAKQAAIKFRENAVHWLHNLSPEEQSQAESERRAQKHKADVLTRVATEEDDPEFWQCVADSIAAFDAKRAEGSTNA
jgi:hypothetical protein